MRRVYTIVTMIIFLTLIVSVTLDSFGIAVTRGAMFSRIKKSSVFFPGLAVVSWQVLVLLIGHSFSQNYLSSTGSWSVNGLIRLLIILAMISGGLYLLHKGIQAKRINEVRQDYLDHKRILLFSVVHSVKFLFVGLIIGLLAIKLSLIILLSVMFLNVFALMLGTYVGHYFGYEFRYVACKFSGALMSFAGVYAFSFMLV